MLFVSIIFKEVDIMDKAKTKVLVSILKDSALYESIPHDEKIPFLLRLAEENPSLFHCEETAPHNRGELHNNNSGS